MRASAPSSTSATAPSTTTTTPTTPTTSPPKTTSPPTPTTNVGQQQHSPSTDETPVASSSQDISTSESEGVRYGKCKWFNVAKGWGFLTPNDGGQEVFVHQSVIQMNGFRSLGEQEEVEFECKLTERGLEATRVSGRQGIDCHGSTFRPRTKKRSRRVRCYNCGEFANHIASKCQLGPQPKRCHLCKQETHLFVDCPMRKTQTSESTDDAAADEAQDDAT